MRMRASERREAVAAAAARLFAARGFDGATVEAIATAAGVTKPIVYRHFGSKQGLYLDLLRRHAEAMPTFFDGVSSASEAGLRTVLSRWFAYVAANPHAWEMIFRDDGGDDEIRAFRLAVQDRARAVLTGFVSTHSPETPAEQIELIAELLRSGLAGLAIWSIDHPEVDRADLIAVALRTVRGALAPPGPCR